MYKKVLGVVLAAVMTFSVATGVVGAADGVKRINQNLPTEYSVGDKDGNTYICYAATNSESNTPTFEEFSSSFKKGLDRKVIDKAKSLFNKIAKLEKEGKFEEASKIWHEIEKLDLFEMKECTFEEFSKQFKKNVDSNTLAKAKELFKKAIDLEKVKKLDEAYEVWNQLYKLDILDYGYIDVSEWSMTFEDFSKDFKKDASKAEIKKAKDIYEKIVKLEKEGNHKKSDELWDQLYELNLFDGNIIPNEPMSFEEFSKLFKKEIDSNTLTKAKELFNKAIALEKENKFDEAYEVWDQIYELDVLDHGDAVNWPMTFEDLAKIFKKDAKKVDINKAKNLFDNFIKLDELEKYDDSQKILDQLFELNLFDDNIVTIEPMSFEELSAEFKKDLSAELKKKAKSLYTKVLELDKAHKHDEAKQKWNELIELDLFVKCK